MAAASESTSQQLQTIQACVLSALEHAAATLDVLAAADGVPKAELAQTCNAFLEQIKTAQAALASILQGLQPLRDFEQTTYASLVHVQALQDQAAIIADMLGPAIAAAEGSGGAPSDAPSAQPPA